MKMNNATHPVYLVAKRAFNATPSEAEKYALKQVCVHLFMQEALTQESALATLRFHYKVWQDRAQKGYDRDTVPMMLQALKSLAADIKTADQLQLV